MSTAKRRCVDLESNKGRLRGGEQGTGTIGSNERDRGRGMSFRINNNGTGSFSSVTHSSLSTLYLLWFRIPQPSAYADSLKSFPSGHSSTAFTASFTSVSFSGLLSGP